MVKNKSMNNRLLRILISISVLLIMIIGGGVVYMVHQHQIKEAEEHQKMVAIATSEEAKKVYEEYLIKIDKEAFTPNGKIQSYQIEKDGLEYNPMGGIMVRLYINDDDEMDIQIGIVENQNGDLEVFGVTSSSKFGNLIRE